MTPTVGEIEYNSEAELLCGANYPPDGQAFSPHIEVAVLDKDATSGEDDEEDLGSLTKEAQWVACEIANIVHNIRPQVFDRKLNQYRPIQYRDIVILLRATKGRAHVFLEELQQVSVPAYAELGTGYFEAVEVFNVLSALQIIDNPEQDIPLAGVLRSPMFGLSGAELAEIRLFSPKSSFFDGVLKASVGDNHLATRLSRFLALLENWRDVARRGSLTDLIWQIYTETEYYNYVGALPGGVQRQANLRALQDRARQYEATTYRGVFRFLRFIDRLRETQGDLGTARALSEGEDVVRLFSIHKSKGLEFPVVFLVGLGNKFNELDLRSALVLHKELGLGPFVVDSALRIKYPTLNRLAILHQLSLDLLSEEMRILY
ncbi:MAG: 3'-5' exonuclease, partial [bacterium]|nr:3'-5' exonuclease [bacterium]